MQFEAEAGQGGALSVPKGPQEKRGTGVGKQIDQKNFE